MNKLIIIFFLAIGTISCNPMHDQIMDFISSKPTKDQFKLWHYLFEKPYDINSEVALQKYKAFKKNIKRFQEINSQNLGYTVGLGPLSDLTWEEIQENYLTLKAEDIPSQEAPKSNVISFDELAEEDDNHDNVKGRFLQGSNSKDWSYLWDYVKDQSKPYSCGSCWAFGTVGVLEAFINIKYNVKVRLSEQQLMDCDVGNGNDACNGGWYRGSFQHIIRNGLMKESDYSYRAYKSTCKHNREQVYLELQSVTSCTNNGSWATCSSNDVSSALAKGPYASAMQVDDGLAHYRQGNWLPRYCTKINHAVVVVQETIALLKIRNSWGDKWGQNGYAYVSKSMPATSGMRGCGLLETVFQPNSFSIRTQ
jgi:hypothetical protein